MLGPGLLVGGSAIGGGEWLAGPAVTARYGGALMWLATLSIVSQVQRTFNGLGQHTNEYQSHSGAVNTSSTPQVQYGYNQMSDLANNSRPTSLTPIPVKAFRSRIARARDPTSCNDGTRRARTMSSIWS